MYICVCQAVTDRQIREAVCQGACSMRELRNHLGVASECGRCARCAHSLLKETLDAVNEPVMLRKAA